ncbi:thioredoxin domain-containing protein [Candidatus Amarobacter glycogenicus]|uniref:thioredoxin domain-containing protein n=1 Tax=Candidatus Amarobacter glycogenicus TaxID=3140699 RepID=UPI002A16FF70|nr:thioredoxin domain-containing protein [Dehalococcoidia bacterium]
MPNRLANETSPYLLQHAGNPVDWYPWGDEAFEKARSEDKPILLSVGYSSCHWCHVMAHESFEDRTTAALMNDYFVNIKVDREERPDVDSVYMTAVQALTGSGGWPMTVFMDAEGRPFYAGTYFPPDDGHGRPGFGRLLSFLHEKWISAREEVLSSAETISHHLKLAAERVPGPGEAPSHQTANRAVELFGEAFDMEWGGFGAAPKFPSPSNLAFLLSVHAREKESEVGQSALDMVVHTLRAMATGGMYDQLGGGFSRYSVDGEWMVPHFEKMLYDNAQLARVYLNAYQVTKDEGFARIVRETLDFLLEEMRDDEGGFYAALDADSEGIEGKYYVWTAEEIREVAGDDAQLVLAWYGVTRDGNFRDPHNPELVGRNVLSARANLEDLVMRFSMPPETVLERVEAAAEAMLAVRAKRVPPALDDKVLTSWNGLAMAAFAEAGRVLGEVRYQVAAAELAAFIRSSVWREGRLSHTWKAGHAKVEGMLDDYCFVGLGLVELFKLTGDMALLEWARELWEAVLSRFRDVEGGGFFETPADSEPLLLRQKAFFDAATPSGNGAAALLGLWLGRYYGRNDWELQAEEVAGQVADHLLRAVAGFGTILQVIEFLATPGRELVIVGPPERRVAFEDAAATRFLPWTAIAPTADADGLPMFEGREPSGDAALAYVCENMMCLMPARTPEELVALLG